MFPEDLYAKLDQEGNGKVSISDIEAFVMPQVRKLLSLRSINISQYDLSLSEITLNIARFVCDQSDLNKDGIVDQNEFEKWATLKPRDYEILEDLFNLAPEFMSKW